MVFSGLGDQMAATLRYTPSTAGSHVPPAAAESQECPGAICALKPAHMRHLPMQPLTFRHTPVACLPELQRCFLQPSYGYRA